MSKPPNDDDREQRIEILRVLKQVPKEKLAKLLVDLLRDQTKTLGRVLADLSELGNIIGYGGKSNDLEASYTVALATHDAAADLAEWVKQQASARLAVAEASGNTHISVSMSPNWSPDRAPPPADPAHN